MKSFVLKQLNATNSPSLTSMVMVSVVQILVMKDGTPFYMKINFYGKVEILKIVKFQLCLVMDALLNHLHKFLHLYLHLHNH